MNTIEKNELIGGFMDFIEYNKSTYQCCFGKINRVLPPQYMEFNTDWNWLMEVVRKIRVLVMEDVTDDLYNSEYWDNITHKLVELEIEAVYNACVEFIQWYNEQKKLNEKNI